jgi:hypothetical protein
MRKKEREVADKLRQAWGVRNITLVDNARVSYSNPVRQSLFEYSGTFRVREQLCCAVLWLWLH